MCANTRAIILTSLALAGSVGGYMGIRSCGQERLAQEAEKAATPAADAKESNPVKERLEARKALNRASAWGKPEVKAKNSGELSKMVAGYVAAGRQRNALDLINRHAYVFNAPGDYLAVASTLTKSLGEAGVMWFYEDSGMGQKRNNVGVIPGFQSKELTIEAATVYALALSMDKRLDERFLRLGFATFTKHLNGREKAVNGMIALYWGFREAVEISCKPLTDPALAGMQKEAKGPLLTFLSKTVKNPEVNEEYRAMAAKLLAFSDDDSLKAESAEYLKGVKERGKRLVELIDKFEAERRANLLDS